jgi:hypothetical protein
MTHDELVDKINILGHTSSWAALRAVVELHKPEHSIRGYRCTFDDETYPCSTIQAIEKELS